MEVAASREPDQRVEVVRGPGSALYGTNAVFGVINVVTKNGADINGVQARVQGGTADTARANILFGKVIDGWDVVRRLMKRAGGAQAATSS